MTDIYGQKCFELSENHSPLGLLVRMCLELYPCLTPSSKVWKQKVTPGGRFLSQLVSLERRTKGKGYGLLPTVTAGDATMGAIIGEVDQFKLTGNGTLRRYNRNGHNSSLSLGRLLTLKNGLDLLLTPLSSHADHNIIPSARKDRSKGLYLQKKIAELLATPTASQSVKPIAMQKRNSKLHGKTTVESIGEHYPSLIGKKINPQFLEWMMGFPKDWTLLTEIDPSETP